MGTPGAGKGTQAKLLASRFGACHISTGDVLREAVRGGSKLGLEAKRYMEQGLLVPDEVVIGIVAERLDGADCKGGFLLDGFPRTVAQAKALDALLARRGQPLGGVLLIALPREDALKRLAGRRVCEQCGAMFHSSFDPPAQPDRCDRCGGRLVQRADDPRGAVRHPKEGYGPGNAPGRSHYPAPRLLFRIGGTRSRPDVFRRVAASL